MPRGDVSHIPVPGPGRPKGQPQPPTLLSDMRAVWKGGVSKRHAKAERASLAEFLSSNAAAFLKQMRDMESDWRKELREWQRDHAAARAAGVRAEAVRVAAVAPEGAEVAAKELAERLLAEWSQTKG